MHAIRVIITGVLMGLADLVPGVSGGTIVLLSGFYERFITALSRIAPTALTFFKDFNFKRAWSAVDANFLVLLAIGIFTSVLTFPTLIQYLMDHQPVAIWSFFTGLVIASVVTIGLTLKRTMGVGILFVTGVVIGYIIAVSTPIAYANISSIALFAAGMIAICAMILPGISGSYLLLLLGVYPIVIGALAERDFILIAIFASGCIAGLAGFSSLLHWLLKHWRDPVLALLLGIMAGGLVKLWPANAAPNSALNPVTVLGFILVGAGAVFLIERLGKNQ